jgi:hypothetical protein
VTQTAKIVALKPFSGSYPCKHEDADTVATVYAEKEGGIVKSLQPRKRYAGRVAVTRHARAEEIDAAKNGKLPSHVELHPSKLQVTVHPVPAVIEVPEDVAAELVKRGLARRYEQDAGPLGTG